MNKFEQLIEYIINDEEDHARALFHDIVVEKSRTIYEGIMDSEEAEFGADSSDDLLDDISADEEGISMEAEEDDAEAIDLDGEEGMDDTVAMGDDDGMSDFGDEGAGEEDLEDRVLDLEDKLEELMSEFEALMGDDEDMDMGDEEDMDMDMGDEGIDDEPLEESLTLSKAPAAKTAEEAGTQTKSPVAANAGKAGAMAKPVAADTGVENGRTAPSAKDMGSTTAPKQGTAPKAVTKEPAGINTKSIS